MASSIELALARQRLQIEAAAQREALTGHIQGLQPVFSAADQVQAGVHWLGRHPEILAGMVALLAATRSNTRRFIWRWGRRAFLGWRLWLKRDRWLQA